ncbi:MAG: transposase, partial [Leptospirales bacterium]|nr:transposase [Leptospirales bacterium]
MLSTTMQLKFSDFEGLYNRLIPKSHILRQMNDLVDFSFVFDELKDKYCLDNGRNAEDPVRMFKYLLLKCMYRMSDNDLVERSMYDMSFKYFLNYRPEDSVI